MNINQGGVTFRKEGALKRLEAQLAKGTKPAKTGDGAIINLAFSENLSMVPLTDSDRKRIEKEISVLRSKLKLQIAA
jgi:hypothetical protein